VSGRGHGFPGGVSAPSVCVLVVCQYPDCMTSAFTLRELSDDRDSNGAPPQYTFRALPLVRQRSIASCVTFHSILYAKQRLCKQAKVQQPLLGNGSVNTLFPRKREHAITEVTLSVRSGPGLYNEN
jgi:hypothetical protein